MENKKRSLENGKWKKIVNKHNKKMVALALAGTLMGIQIPGNIEQVEASQVSVASTTTTNSSTFLTAVRRMDNLAAIKQMNVKSLGNISDSVTTARSIYDKLPAEAKADKGVLRWEGYLTQKEEGIANRFVALSAQLPTNNQMERMSANDLVVARSRINKIRNLHSKLPTNAKVNSGVNRWEGYLTQKEDAAGITFVNAARALPSVAEIKEMNEEELLKYYEEAEKVKDAFNSLSDTAKSNTQVSTWGTYLATKEDAAYEVAEELEVELPETPEEPTEPETPVEPEVPEEPEESEVPEEPVEEVKTVTKTETIEFDVEVIEVIDLDIGEEKVLQEGVNGEQEVVYEQVFEDGKLVKVTELSRTTTRESVTKVVEIGVELTLDIELFGQEMLKEVNKLRASVGVAPLQYDSNLQAGVNIRADEIVDVFTHERPDGSSPFTAFDGINSYRSVGENIARNYDSGTDTGGRTKESVMAEVFVRQYAKSSGHYANMVNERFEYFATGVTVYNRINVTNVQIFGGR